MNRFTNHKPLNIKDISKTRLFIGFVLGIGASVLFYFFQQYLFVLYRTVVLSLQFNINHELNTKLVVLLRFIFAGNAVILGNSLVLSFLFSGPIGNITKRGAKRNVVNNQSFFVGSYFFWFLEIGSLVGGVAIDIGLVDLSKLIFIIYPLLFAVLFLEQVKYLRKDFENYSIKNCLYHFFVLIVISFCISNLKTSNYFKVGRTLNKIHPYAKVPKVSFEDKDSFQAIRYGFRNLQIKMLREKNRVVYRVGDRNLSLREVSIAAVETLTYRGRPRRGQIIVYADDNIFMKDIRALERELISVNAMRITYSFDKKPEYRDYHKSGAEKYLFPSQEIVLSSAVKHPISRSIDFENYGTKIMSSKIINVSIKAFDKQKNRPYEYFKSKIGSDIFFNFQYDGTESFSQYLKVFASYKQAVYDLRKENETIDEYFINYFDSTSEEKSKHQLLWKSEQKLLKKKYPLHYVDNYILDIL